MGSDRIQNPGVGFLLCLAAPFFVMVNVLTPLGPF